MSTDKYKRVFISAGHGGADPGACVPGYSEAAIATDLRQRVATKLAAAGAPYLTDGPGDVNLPLPQAIKLAQTCDGPRVEFHTNAAVAPTAGGVECLSLPAHKQLAQDLARAVASVLGIATRGTDGGWKSDDSGQHHRLGFCREGSGCILELFFITNPTELKSYLANRDALADVIADVLMAHAAAQEGV